MEEGKNIFHCIRLLVNHGTPVIGGWVILFRGCPVRCEKFSSIPGLYPLDASGTPPHLQCLQTLPNAPWGTESPPAPHIENHWIPGFRNGLSVTTVWEW